LESKTGKGGQKNQKGGGISSTASGNKSFPKGGTSEERVAEELKTRKPETRKQPEEKNQETPTETETRFFEDFVKMPSI